MSGPPLRIATLTGNSILPWLHPLGQLRIAVFRDWPYLYEGDEDYELNYMRVYAESPRAAVVVAFDGDRPVGASTCIPLADELDSVIAPFRARGWEPERFFYFGELVLLPAYRGRGVGVAFFEAREGHARQVSDCDYSCFCAVQRPAEHPLRPADYVPLDAFWRKRGYAPYPDLACRFSWRDADTGATTEKSLSFWIKKLRDAPLP